MAVKRIIANIGVERINAARTFYGDILGMSVVMDHGWIVTFAADASAPPKISIATEGGSGTPVPDLSIEVDDIDFGRRCNRSGFRGDPRARILAKAYLGRIPEAGRRRGDRDGADANFLPAGAMIPRTDTQA
jgi:catechol 2,3-dioxygenase-like lactoylglutathione lyase family enzyme